MVGLVVDHVEGVSAVVTSVVDDDAKTKLVNTETIRKIITVATSIYIVIILSMIHFVSILSLFVCICVILSVGIHVCYSRRYTSLTLNVLVTATKLSKKDTQMNYIFINSSFCNF